MRWRRFYYILPILLVQLVISVLAMCFVSQAQIIGTKKDEQMKQNLKVELKSILPERSKEANTGIFSPDGKNLVSLRGADTAVIWDVATGHIIATMQGYKYISNVVFSPNGKIVAVSNAEGIIRLFDSNNGASKIYITERDVFVELSFSPDSRILATSSSKSPLVSLKDVETGRTTQVLQHPKQNLPYHKESVGNVAFNPVGQIIATSDYGKAYLWNAANGKLEAILIDEKAWMDYGNNPFKEIKGLSHSDTIYHLSFSPDGTTLGTASRDGTAKLWDIESRKLRVVLKHRGKVIRVLFSPDSQTVATLSEDKTAKLWDVATGQLKATLKHRGTVWSLSFSFDNKLVATYSDNERRANIWDANTGELLVTLDKARGPIMFSPKENLLATGDKDNKVLLWKVSY